MENSTESPEEVKNDDFYKIIGKCTVKFEHVCYAMQSTVVALLKQAGLNNFEYSEILIAGTTAEPLLKHVRGMIGEYLKKLPEEQKTIEEQICVNIFNRVKKLTEERNKIIHATWSRDTNKKIISGRRNKSTQKGFDKNITNLPELEKFADNCDIISALIDYLWSSIVIEKPLTQVFTKDN